MKYIKKNIAFTIVIFLLLAFSANPVCAANRISKLDDAIDSWNLNEAQGLLNQLTSEELSLPKTVFLKGKFLFFKGQCADALKLIREAIKSARTETEWKFLRDITEQTREVFSKLEIRKGKTDRFLFRYLASRDAILIPYAEETLEKQWEVLSKLFNDKPKLPIEIDLLPDMESLARVSGLSVDQLERTGTIGVTKYGRVMIVTPRKLVTGYPWLDTLAHELTHFFITRLSRNKAPIWLHEGISKLLERSWRSKEFQELCPEEAYLLDRAVNEGRLIPLRRFHPSIAYLPDQEDAALAYAQVLSFVHYLNSRLGENGLRKLLRGLGEGKGLDNILISLSKFGLKRLYVWWKQMASGKRHTPVPAVGLMKRRFKRGNVAGKSPHESLFSDEVKRYIRVGDLLRLRGHLKAAVIEFDRAKKLMKSPHPEVSDRLGACLLELGKTKEVISILSPMTKLYPSHSTTFIKLGLAMAAEKKIDQAIDILRRANAINPFHPEVHCILADLYTKQNQTKKASLETKHCHMAASYLASGNKGQIK